VLWTWESGQWKLAKAPDVNGQSFVPELTNLDEGKAYWLYINPGEGDFSWEPDYTKPTVTTVSPANGATNIATNTSSITATFSESMDESSIYASTFTVQNSSGASVSGTVTYDPSTNKVTFIPSSTLAYSTTYTAKLNTGVKDLAGNALASDYTWTFTTVNPPSQSPAGIWKGTAYSTGWARYYSVASIILPTNEVRGSTGTSQDVGNASVTNGNSLRISSTSYAADGYIFYDGSLISTNVCQGTLVTKQSFSGTCTNAGDSGPLSLYYSPIYERTSSLSKLSGWWEYYDSYKRVTYYLNINGSGQITGGDSTYTCSMNGAASVISSGYNAYRINITLANCGTGNDGGYSGLAYLDDTVSSNDTFMALISKGDKAISVPFLKK
jgi:hypothetical protein